MVTAACLVAMATLRHFTFLVRRKERPAAPDPLALAMLIRIGLSAGLSLRTTLESVREAVGPRDADAIDAVLRRGLVTGLSEALRSPGHADSRLFRLLAEAHMTGAPLAFAVSTFIVEESDRRRAVVLEQARTVPIRLTIPVALGFLPGFVLIAVAPEIALALQGLLEQVTGR